MVEDFSVRFEQRLTRIKTQKPHSSCGLVNLRKVFLSGRFTFFVEVDRLLRLEDRVLGDDAL